MKIVCTNKQMGLPRDHHSPLWLEISSWRTLNLLLSTHLASNPRFGTITLMTPLLFGSMDNCIFRSFCHASMIYIRTWKLKTTEKYLFWTSQWRGKITLLPSRFSQLIRTGTSTIGHTITPGQKLEF